jgi:hypothetical protein
MQKKRVNAERPHTFSEGGRGTDEVIKGAIQNHKDSLRRKVTRAKGRGAPPTLSEANAMWKIAYDDAFGEFTEDHISQKQWGRFLRSTKNHPLPDVAQFFADVCNNWVHLLEGELSWVKNKDHVPLFGDVVSLVRYIRIALERTSIDIQKQHDRFTGVDTAASPPKTRAKYPLPKPSVSDDEAVGGWLSAAVAGANAIAEGDLLPAEPDATNESSYGAGPKSSTLIFFDTDDDIPQYAPLGAYQLRNLGTGTFELYVYLGRRRKWETTYQTLKAEMVDGLSREQLIKLIEDLEL